MSEAFLGLIAPHPPVIIPAVGGPDAGRARETLAAYKRATAALHAYAPETVVIISPHGTLFQNAVNINCADKLSGTLADFGHPEVGLTLTPDTTLRQALIAACVREELSIAEMTDSRATEYQTDNQLDHGVIVPLLCLGMPETVRLVSVTYGLLDNEQLYRFGRILSRVIDETGRRIAVIASGDLSHAHGEPKADPYRLAGGIFDDLMCEVVQTGDFKRLKRLDSSLCKTAKECGFRSILMLAGALHGRRIRTTVFAYERPFGVGYLTAVIEGYGRKEMDSRVKLARNTVAFKLGFGKDYDYIPERLLAERAACFVTLHKFGNLRGCIGSPEPTCEHLGDEIRKFALKAAFEDPRFPPVTREELADIEFTVDVLGKPEPVSDIRTLDPARYGIIVRSGFKSGLLLPALTGVKSARHQLEIAKCKAGIGPDEDVEIRSFEVVRYE